MRKVFWCCLAAGAAVCCAFWAVAYISQNPDSPLGRYALNLAIASGHASAVGSTSHPGQNGTADADDVIPPDPVPVDDLPPLPAPGSQLPPAVAALIPPPIVIHDEDDLNAPAGPHAQTEALAAGRFDVEGAHPATYDANEIGRTLDGGPTADHAVVPAMMPYCTDDDGQAPHMPYCTDDDGKSSCGPLHPSDAFALWLGFFSGPSHLFPDLSVGRCEEDAHYGQQYPGLPYTVRVSPLDQPARADLKPLPAFSGAEETSEPPAPKAAPHADPTDLFSHPHHLSMPRPTDPASDTMEMRPSDWKPYSLDPGPF